MNKASALLATFSFATLAYAPLVFAQEADNEQTPPNQTDEQQNDANAAGSATVGGSNDADEGRDPEPEVPGIPDIDAEMVEQAGTGSDNAFASAGVVEVGGHGSVELAPNLKLVSMRPQIGWFLADNFQLSAIAELAWSQVELEGGGDDNRTLFGLYAEPSYHLPFNNRTLGFIGVGVGPTYDSNEFGFSIRPRLGLDVLLGRSGIFRPAFEVTYSTVDVVSRNNTNLVGVSTTYGLSLGFSTML